MRLIPIGIAAMLLFAVVSTAGASPGPVYDPDDPASVEWWASRYDWPGIRDMNGTLVVHRDPAMGSTQVVVPWLKSWQCESRFWQACGIKLGAFTAYYQEFGQKVLLCGPPTTQYELDHGPGCYLRGNRVYKVPPPT